MTRAFGFPQAFSGVPGTDLHWVAKQVGENKELVVLAPWVSYAHELPVNRALIARGRGHATVHGHHGHR